MQVVKFYRHDEVLISRPFLSFSKATLMTFFIIGFRSRHKNTFFSCNNINGLFRRPSTAFFLTPTRRRPPRVCRIDNKKYTLQVWIGWCSRRCLSNTGCMLCISVQWSPLNTDTFVRALLSIISGDLCTGCMLYKKASFWYYIFLTFSSKRKPIRNE